MRFANDGKKHTATCNDWEQKKEEQKKNWIEIWGE